MNLAEIRKKALLERQQRGPGAVPEIVHQAAGLQREPNQAVDLDVVMQLEDSPSNRLAPTDRFDPLAAIIAGREAAGCDAETVVESVTQASESNLVELLCVRVSAECYAIDIMVIKEIIRPRALTEVPRVPSFVLGVLSLRGNIVPVYDLRRRLNLPTVPPTGRERIVVVKVGEEFRGILVDEVIQVALVHADTIEPPPAVLDGIDREFVAGIGRSAGMMLILLDLDSILNISLA